METAQNTALTELQTFVGTQSSAIGTLMYDIRAAASNGGGHVQTANKGGTGQTSYAKGDILVASSSSVLSKLTVGSDNQVVIANSSTASGIQWAAVPGNKLHINAGLISMVDATTSTSVYSINIAGSTLGTSNAIKSTTYLNLTQMTGSVKALLTYGGGYVSSMTFVPKTNNIASVSGQLNFTLMAANSPTSQMIVTQANLNTKQMFPDLALSATSSLISMYTHGVSSINSDAAQTLALTFQGFDVRAEIHGTIVEKIN